MSEEAAARGQVYPVLRRGGCRQCRRHAIYKTQLVSLQAHRTRHVAQQGRRPQPPNHNWLLTTVCHRARWSTIAVRLGASSWIRLFPRPGCRTTCFNLQPGHPGVWTARGAPRPRLQIVEHSGTTASTRICAGFEFAAPEARSAAQLAALNLPPTGRYTQTPRWDASGGPADSGRRSESQLPSPRHSRAESRGSQCCACGMRACPSTTWLSQTAGGSMTLWPGQVGGHAFRRALPHWHRGVYRVRQ